VEHVQRGPDGTPRFLKLAEYEEAWISGQVCRKSRSISKKEVERHNRPDDAWIIVNREVINVTSWMQDHPGGSQVLVEFAGGDASHEWNQIHGPEALRNARFDAVQAIQGRLDEADDERPETPGQTHRFGNCEDNSVGRQGWRRSEQLVPVSLIHRKQETCKNWSKHLPVGGVNPSVCIQFSGEIQETQEAVHAHSDTGMSQGLSRLLAPLLRGERQCQGQRRLVSQIVPIDFIAGVVDFELSLGHKAVWDTICRFAYFASLVLSTTDLWRYYRTPSGTAINNCADFTTGTCDDDRLLAHGLMYSDSVGPAYASIGLASTVLCAVFCEVACTIGGGHSLAWHLRRTLRFWNWFICR